MHQLAVGLSGVEVIADDFFEVGFGDSMGMHHLVEELSGVEVKAVDFVVVVFGDSMEDASVGRRAVWCRGHS